MSIINYQASQPGVVQSLPRRPKLVVTDSLSTLLGAGYLNSAQNLEADPLLPTDVIDCIYNYSSNVNSLAGNGNHVELYPVINNGSVTLYQFSSDIVWFDITVNASALANAGKVVVQGSSGSMQFQVRDIRMNKSTGLSGGGGDRLLALTDGTNTWTGSGITAALLGTPVNTVWGGSGLPLPSGSNAFSTLSAAGANIYLQYTGGTTDFGTGSVIISIAVQRIV